MITELLDAAIDEVNYNAPFELTEFQLGFETMKIFIDECRDGMNIPVEAIISGITKYKGIPIKEHSSENAVMYSISLKKK